MSAIGFYVMEYDKNTSGERTTVQFDNFEDARAAGLQALKDGVDPELYRYEDGTIVSNWSCPECFPQVPAGLCDAVQPPDPAHDTRLDSILAALERVNQIIGNDETISAEQLGEVRGIVLGALSLCRTDPLSE